MKLGDFTVFEGHGYPLVLLKYMSRLCVVGLIIRTQKLL
jgi:hypothetical protein